MAEFLQQVFSGLSIGMVYGGIALSLSVVFQGTGVLNFAQAEMAGVCVFLAWALLAAGVAFWLAFALVLVAGFVLGVVVERVLIRPVEEAPELSILIVTLGLFLALNAIIGLVWGYLPKNIDSPFGTGTVSVGGALLTAQQLGMTVAVLAALLAVGALFRFTDVGLRLRAAALNPASSRLLGIRVGRQLMLGWGIAAAVGAVAGVMSAPVIGVAPEVMSSVILLAFAAAAFGGFQSRVGAVLGGLFVGVMSNLTNAYVPGLSGDLDVALPFLLIVLILLVRPQGLFGRATAARA